MEVQVHETILKKYLGIITVTFNCFHESVVEKKIKNQYH